MIIKTPACYDVSAWEDIPDWGRVTPKPLLVICKASEYRRDATFDANMQGLAANNIARWAYHFHRKAVSATTQAQLFCDIVRPYVYGGMKLVLDVEEGGETAAQLIAWIDYVKGRYPNNEVIIYSRKNLLDPIIMTSAQAARLRTVRVWTAGYPDNPDLYNAPLSWYIPDSAKYGSVILWQYSERGAVSGIAGAVDLNWISPALIQELSGAAADTTTTLYNGVKRVTGTRYGWKFSLLILDAGKVWMEVRHPVVLSTGTQIAKTYEAPILVNGGEPDKATYFPEDYSVSFGNVYVPRKSFRPSLMITKDGRAVIDTKNAADVRHAITGLRPIVINGTVAPYLYDPTHPEYSIATATEGHSRSCHALTAGGNSLILTSEGRYPNQGLTLKQAAELLIQYGAVKAFDSGGGGDVTEVIGGVLTNTPENILNGVNVQRYLGQFLLVYPITTTGGTTMANYEVVSATYDMSLRTDHNISAARTETVLKNTVMKADQLWTASADGINVKAGDTWAHIVAVGSVAKDAWTAVIHLGVRYCTVKEIVPPSTGAPASMDIALAAGSTVTVKDASGAVLWTGKA